MSIHHHHSTAVVPAALLAALLAGCSPSDDETDFLARKALLQRQNQGLRELVVEAEQGSLVPKDRFLIGLDEAILADIFRSQLPLELTSGHGEADIHFVWDGKRVAGLTCGDMDVTQNVSGDVVPSAYEVTGALALELVGNQVLAVPSFPETRVNIRVQPTADSWKAIDAILAEKNDVCGWVIEKVDVKKILNNVVAVKGFNVKLPLGGIKPMALPAGVSETVKVGERSLALDVRTTTLRIDPDAIWYGADVTVSSAPPAAAAPDSSVGPRTAI